MIEHILLELKTSNLVHGFGWRMTSRRTKISPKSGRGLDHVTPTILAVRSAILATTWLLVLHLAAFVFFLRVHLLKCEVIVHRQRKKTTFETVAILAMCINLIVKDVDAPDSLEPHWLKALNSTFKRNVYII